MPTTEEHPMKTTGKAEHSEMQKQKESPKMGRQWKNPQWKRMEDYPVKELNEMDAKKVSNRIQKNDYKDVQGTHNCKELSENYNSMKKEIETINKNEEEMNNTISEIKNTLNGITRKLDEAEDWISELEDKVETNTQVEQLHKKRPKNMKIP